MSVNDPENYFQGDMDLSEQQVKKLEEELKRGNRKKRKVNIFLYTFVLRVLVFRLEERLCINCGTGHLPSVSILPKLFLDRLNPKSGKFLLSVRHFS